MSNKDDKKGAYPYDKKGAYPYEKKGALITPSHSQEVSVDANANPFLPIHLQYAEHRQLGQRKLVLKDGALFIDDKKVILVSCDDVRFGIMLSEAKLREELSLQGLTSLNANFRDALCEHFSLIPSEWHEKCIFFTSSWFEGRGGDRYLPFLYEGVGGNWTSHNLQAPHDPKSTFFGRKAYIVAV